MKRHVSSHSLLLYVRVHRTSISNYCHAVPAPHRTKRFQPDACHMCSCTNGLQDWLFVAGCRGIVSLRWKRWLSSPVQLNLLFWSNDRHRCAAARHSTGARRNEGDASSGALHWRSYLVIHWRLTAAEITNDKQQRNDAHIDFANSALQ